MYKNRFGATDMFVMIARQIYHVTLTAQGSKQSKINVNNHFQLKQTRCFSCKSVKKIVFHI